MIALKRKQWEPWAFASPSLFLIALVIVFPLAYAFYLSLQNFDLSVGPGYEYVGLANYREALQKTFLYAVPDPIIPGANEYGRKLSFEVTEALAKRKSPKEALDSAAVEWDKITDRRGRDKQKALWGEKMGEMKQLGIEYQPDWAAKAK